MQKSSCTLLLNLRPWNPIRATIDCWLCRKVGFWRQNPKIGSRKTNHLRVSTFLFSVICDRAHYDTDWEGWSTT
jgi:hypothetical protein